ncbi:ATP-binding protein [Embleya sp. MST-111070]|uniref:ATP-binding protein n=1 Tax=Embleya sp. MST-111070 TaxID=3398231 RepID=UPI003F738347
MTGPNRDRAHARARIGAGPVEVLPFGASDLCLVRAVVRRHADAVGLGDDRPDCLVLAVHEIAACAVTSDSRPALLRCVPRAGQVVCEIHAAGDDGGGANGGGVDGGRADGGHADGGCRRRAFPRLTDKQETPGRGLWIARALCDEVEVAECAEGVVVRMTMHLTASTSTGVVASEVVGHVETEGELH